AEAERWTGRTAFTLPRFADVAARLAPAGEREAFQTWYHGGSEQPFLLRVETPQGPRDAFWLHARQKAAGEVVQHLLLGIERPEGRDVEGQASGVGAHSYGVG
ncbi:MAG: hypothetical protein R3362_11390, partial [Rhodothermales bacterium]|nr:hypothetical protein [Rhodothermales bacterium]